MSTFRQHLEQLRRRARTESAIMALEQLGAAYSDMNIAAGRLQERYRVRAADSTRLRLSDAESRAQLEKFEADLIEGDDAFREFLLMQEVDSEVSLHQLRRIAAVFRRLEADDLAVGNALS